MNRVIRQAISLTESAATLPFRTWRGMMKDFGVKDGSFLGGAMKEATYIGEGMARLPFRMAREFWTDYRSQDSGIQGYDHRIAELEGRVSQLEQGPAAAVPFPQPNSPDSESAGSGI